MTAKDMAAQLATKRGELAAVFEKHKKADGTYDMPAEVLADVRGRNEELDKLTKEWEGARDLEAIARKNGEEKERLERVERPPFGGRKDDGGSRIGGGSQVKTLGELIMESKAVAEHRAGRKGISSVIEGVDLKTLMSRSDGWDPEDTRTGKVLLSAQMPPRVVDFIPKTTTGQSTVVYMEETTFTNNAAEAAEGATYGEAALKYEEKTSEVRKIAVSLPVTDEMLEDTERLRDLIDNRLRFMLMKRLDQQCLTGNGTAPNLRGVNNLSGINTQAKGSDPVFDAIYKGIILVFNDVFDWPDGIVMHPSDWQDVRLTRTSDGQYILGNPDSEVTPRLFGLPVAVTTHQTENTATLGLWKMHSELAMRRGIEVQISNSHSTFFTEGKQMLRADMRVALVLDRATAFATVTGI